MDERLGPEIRAVGRRLNAAILCHRALSWTLLAAIAAGAFVAFLRALGLATANYPLWLGLVAAATALGGFLARTSLVGEAGVARWLDERLGAEGLLSAALVCLGRGKSGRFDGEIVDRALALLPQARDVKYPRGPLARKAALSLAALAIGAYLIFLAAPLARPRAAPGNPVQAEGAAAGDKALSLRRAQESGQAASAFAASLFPTDRRRATLAERALREGRMDNLRDLLKSADMDYGSRLAGQVSEPERKRLTEERSRLQEASQALDLEYRQGRGGRADRPGEPGDSEGPSARGGGADRRQGGSLAEKGGGGSGAEGSRGGRRPKPQEEGGALGGSGGESGDEGGAGQGMGSGGSSASRGWGTGPGQEGNWGRIEPPAKPGRLVVEPSKDSAFFELVLPGQAPKGSLSSLLPDSMRASESAMSRESIPFEYRDFVSSYFLSLSKGEAR